MAHSRCTAESRWRLSWPEWPRHRSEGFQKQLDHLRWRKKEKEKFGLFCQQFETEAPTVRSQQRKHNSYRWTTRSWVCRGLAWASSRPRWPWWGWVCCWPSRRASRPTSACGSCLWRDTNCRFHWGGERHSQWLPSHLGFCRWPGFFHGLHFRSSVPGKPCCPS